MPAYVCGINCKLVITGMHELGSFSSGQDVGGLKCQTDPRLEPLMNLKRVMYRKSGFAPNYLNDNGHMVFDLSLRVEGGGRRTTVDLAEVAQFVSQHAERVDHSTVVQTPSGALISLMPVAADPSWSEMYGTSDWAGYSVIVHNGKAMIQPFDNTDEADLQVNECGRCLVVMSQTCGHGLFWLGHKPEFRNID